MTEKLLDVLKSFSEVINKHLAPVVLSCVIGIAVYLYVGDTFWMVKRLSMGVFVFFTSCIAFLVIEMVLWLALKMKQWRSKREQREYERKQEAEHQAEEEKKLRDWFDTFTPNTLEIIQQLLNTDNQPIEVDAWKLQEGFDMLMPGYVSTGNNFKTNLFICKFHHVGNKSCYKVVMQDEVYQMARYLFEKYGKLSRFDL